MTASTVTVAHIRPSWSIPPIIGDSAVIWTVALKRLAPRTLLLTVDWRRTRSPVKRPESRSAWTASDPLKGMRKESLRTVRNPRTAYMISCMNIVSAAARRPPGWHLAACSGPGSYDSASTPASSWSEGLGVRAEMNLTQRPEVADLRTSVVCEHIRNLRIQPARGGARGAREARH